MKERILITGASGFIGGYLVPEALDRGFEVYAAVRSTSSREFLADPRIRFFPFDFNRKDQLLSDLSAFGDKEGGFDYVVHGAAITTASNLAHFDRGNAVFTADFASALMETQPLLKKFIYLSSMAALGPGDPQTMAPIAEDHPPSPLTPYGRSKYKAEQLLKNIASLPYVVLRPTGVYGPRDRKLALRMIGLLRKGIDVRISPPGQQLSFVHVEDVVSVILDACTSGLHREALNIADGRFYSPEEFNGTLKEMLGVSAIPLRIPIPLLSAIGYFLFYFNRMLRRSVHLSHFKMQEVTAKNWKVDISRARSTIGFDPQYDLRSGLQDVVDKLNTNAVFRSA